MTIRICSAALILVLWLSPQGAHSADSVLGALVRKFRESPTPEGRSDISNYIASHPGDAALANLALGVAAFEQKNFTEAIALLKPLPAKLPQIADYPAYYLAAAQVEANDFADVAAELAPAHRNSPLSGDRK